MNSLTCMSEWIYDILTSTASWVSLVSLVMSSCFMHSLVLFPDYRKRIWERDYSWLPFLNIAHFRVHAVQPWVLAVRFCIFSSLSEVMQSPGHSPRKQGTLWKWTNYLSGELIPESGGNKDCLHSNVLVYSNCVSVCVSNSFLRLDFLSVSVVSQPPALVSPLSPSPPSILLHLLFLLHLLPYHTGWQPRWFILDSGILSYYLGPSEVNQGCRDRKSVV